MNAERDTDRRLRAWVSEGVDRAPEHFVWAALDEIERMPQRRLWRTVLDGFSDRLRPLRGALAGAAIAFVALAIFAQVVGPADGPGQPGRDLALADLNGIVLWQDTMPRSWTLDNLVSNMDEVLRIPVRSGAEPARPRGYIGGRYTDFSGPAAVFMSWGTVFESPADAAAALPFYQNEMASPAAWGLQPRPVELGDDGFVYEGETTALMGPPTGSDPIRATIYLWRNGNTLLAIAGWFDFDADELRAQAEAMDARANASALRLP